MRNNQQYSDTVQSDSHEAHHYDVPEPCENWSLADFEDLIPQNL